MEKAYSRINFENSPSTKTPLNAINLNKMDKAVDDLDDRSLEINSRLEDVEVMATDNEKKLSELERKAEDNYELIYSVREETKESIEKLQEADNNISTSISDLSADLDTLTRTTSPAITENAIGTSISVEGTAEGYVEINEVVGADEQETTSGKNLKNVSDFTLVGTTNWTFQQIGLSGVIELGETYTASFYTDYKEKMTVRIMDETTSVDGVPQKELTASDGRISLTFTVSDNIANYNKMLIYAGLIGQTNGNTVKVWDFQIEKGTVATDYEPYTGGIASPNPAYPQSIDSVVVSEIMAHGGANQFDDSKALSGYTLNDTDGSAYQLSGWYTSDYIEVQGGETYYLTKGEYGLSNCFYDSNKNFIGKVYLRYGTITAPMGAKYMRFNGSLLELSGVKFEKCVAIILSKPITLHSKDRIVKLDGVLDVGRGMATLNVAECTITDWGAGGDGHDFFINVEAWDDTKQRNLQALCNKFIYRADAMAINHFWYKSNVGGWDGYSRLAFRVPADINTVAKFKEYVGNDCIVLYETKETTFEPLPTADQIALNSLKSFDGVTYVETDSEVKATLNVDCVLDTKAYIDKKFAELQAVLTAE